MDANDLSSTATAHAANEMADNLGLDHPTPLGAELAKRTYRQFMSEQLSGQDQRGMTRVPRFYLDTGKLKSLWIDAVIGLSYLSTTGGGSGFESLTNVFAKALTAFKLLSEDEAEAVHVILYVSRGHAYTTPVPEANIRASYIDATVSIDDILASLEQKGVLKRASDSVALVP